ncbi:MAG TPA: hypothetical protein VF190_10630 [Rhodothermales bacterium]
MQQGPDVSRRDAGVESFSEADVRLRPRVNVLSNGRLYSALTAAGAGCVVFDGLALNRWRSDPTSEDDGIYLYVRDLEDGRFWSASLQPDATSPDAYDVRFDEGLVRIERLQHGIRSVLEVFVDADRDVELRQLTLRNESDRQRRVDVTSLVEIALNEPEADHGHPAFSKLFVQTAYDAYRHAVRAWRRLRSPDERPAHLVHALLGAGQPDGFESSRPDFLGRGRDARSPLALTSRDPLRGLQGSVLDPVAALRRRLDLAPGSEASIVSILGAARSEEDLYDTLGRFGDDPGAIQKAMDRALRAARKRLEESGLTSEDLPGFRRLTSALFYPTGRTRAATGDMAAKSHLAAFGLRPTRPFLLAGAAVSQGDGADVRLRRFHAHLAALGVAVDLFDRPLPDDPADAALIRRAAVAPGGSTDDVESANTGFPGAAQYSRIKRDDGATALPGGDEPLQFDNGYGGFSEDGREYVVRMKPGPDGRPQLPPQPWTNVIANERIGFIVSETGASCTWNGNSRENRLTPWLNDWVTDPHTEALFLRDEEARTYWSPLPGPAPAPAPYGTRHGLGYTVFHHASAGLEQETTQFVVRDRPVKVTRLRLRNATPRPRTISVFHFVPLVLGSRPDLTRPFVDVEWDESLQAIIARNDTNDEFREHRVFVAARGATAVSHSTDREAFLGRLGSLEAPQAVVRGDASAGETGSAVDPCAAHQLRLDLSPYGQATVAFLMGDLDSREEMSDLLASLADASAWETTLEDVREFWSSTTGRLRLATPSPEIDLMVNAWLPYQNLSCRMWGRSAFYQSGGAFGYRDQLQDSAGLLYLDPQITRRQILLHAANQFVEGDVMHWWHPPTGKGIRTRFSDDLLWLPYVTSFYVRATGDRSVLDESAPYLTARALQDGEDEVFLQPQPSGTHGSVYEHCCRSIDRSLATGAHGLPLMGTGDWNDGMNRVGREGRGESVWLGFFLYHLLARFIPFCEERGDTERAARYTAHRERLREALNDGGWDGAWYRRAYYDDGTPLGASDNDECRIDALAQAWAVISRAAPPERAEAALDAMVRELVDEEAGIIRLLTPAFDCTPKDPGYIKGYVPGVRENGGQYTHGVLWAVRALAEADRGDLAGRLLAMLSPISHADTREAADRYRVEPYVIAADVYGEPPHVGRGGWTWYTGSAAWMYRVAVESVVGFRLENGTHMVLEPSIPPDWPSFSLSWQTPGDSTAYEITVRNDEGRSRGIRHARVDGWEVPCEDGILRVELARDGSTHRIEATM